MGERGAAFVLLRHETPDGVHWDLMLDTGSLLTTWQLSADPTAIDPEWATIPAKRLPDHRRAYLEYEGPVSRNRGWVTQTDRGTYHLLKDESLSCAVSLSGERLSGRYELRSQEPGSESWLFRRLD